MSYLFRMHVQNEQGRYCTLEFELPPFDLDNPTDEVLEVISHGAQRLFRKLRIEENVKPVNNLPKWF